MNLSRQNIKCKLNNKGLVFEHPSNKTIRFDSEGRWGLYFDGGVYFRRTVDSLITRSNKDGIFFLDKDLYPSFHDIVNYQTRFFLEELKRDKHQLEVYGSIATLKEIIKFLEKAVLWNKDKFIKMHHLFKETYIEGIPILPPDRYHDIVLLPATGCPNNQCQFCTFYKESKFRIFSVAEFKKHIQNVLKLFGRAINDRSGIFLGSASALSIGQGRLVEFLEIINYTIESQKRKIAAFHDPDHAPSRTVKEYIDLVQRELNHITIGFETGYTTLRKQLGKSDNLERIKKVIFMQKEAGIRNGITILVGAGGIKDRKCHIKDTIGFIDLPLDKDDIIYLSPFEGTLTRGQQPLTSEQLQEEQKTFSERLVTVTNAKIAPYRMEIFHYYS